MSPYYVFYAHPKVDTAEERQAVRVTADRLRALLQDGTVDPDRQIIVVTGYEDFDKRYRSQARGNFERWTQLVSQGRHVDGAPYYRACVVPFTPTERVNAVGRGTSNLLRGFQDADKPVLAWDEGTGLWKVRSLIRLRDEDSWARWAALVVDLT